MLSVLYMTNLLYSFAFSKIGNKIEVNALAYSALQYATSYVMQNLYNFFRSNNEGYTSSDYKMEERMRSNEEIELKTCSFHVHRLLLNSKSNHHQIDVAVDALKYQESASKEQNEASNEQVEPTPIPTRAKATFTRNGSYIEQKTHTSHTYIDHRETEVKIGLQDNHQVEGHLNEVSQTPTNNHVTTWNQIQHKQTYSKRLLYDYQSRVVPPGIINTKYTTKATSEHQLRVVLVERCLTSTDRHTLLGSIWFDDDVALKTLSNLRYLILKNVAHLPRNFTFLQTNSFGNDPDDVDKLSYTNQNQEQHIIAKDMLTSDGFGNNLIYIQSCESKLRIGIIECTGHGICLGSIFCNLNDSLAELRFIIDCHLKQLTSILDEGRGLYSRLKNFIFFDENFWPITPQQESLVEVHSIVSKNKTIAIKSSSLADTMVFVGHDNLLARVNKTNTLLEPNTENSLKTTDERTTILGSKDTLKAKRNWKFIDISLSPQSAIHADSPRLSTEQASYENFLHSIHSKNNYIANQLQLHKSNTDTRELKLTNSELNHGKKVVMLSYVRREAAIHAVNLKDALENLGVSVYLDVHEIKSGSDWQDSLNEAVSCCLVFVPLVTSSYGQTLWSNREIKLADVLNKHIVPVNFGQSWPPSCLAIQFATTQYICWKPSELECIERNVTRNEGGQVLYWPRECILKVALLIKNNIDSYIHQNVPTNNGNPAELFTKEMNSHSSLSDLINGHNHQINSEQRHLVVVSHHQKDKIAVERIKATLESNSYNVWLVKTSNSRETFESNGIEIDCICTKKHAAISCRYGSCSTLNSTLKPHENYDDFLLKISESRLVILVGSRDYFESSMSKIHVFYCESRKPLILFKVDDYQPPQYFQMLLKGIPTIDRFSGAGKESHSDQSLLLHYIESILKTKPAEALDRVRHRDEERLNELFIKLKESLPPKEQCIFIADGLQDSDLYADSQMQQVCINLGMELSRIDKLVIVTSSKVFAGPSSLIARTFLNCRAKNLIQQCRAKEAIKTDSVCVYRIINLNDSEMDDRECEKVSIYSNEDGQITNRKLLSSKSSQLMMDSQGDNDKSTIDEIQYSEFSRDCYFDMSDDERCTILARTFDVCLLIGWQRNSEVQKFNWNGNFIIPVLAKFNKVNSLNKEANQYPLEGDNPDSETNSNYKIPALLNERDWDLITRSGYYSPIELSRTISEKIIQLKKVSSMTKKLHDELSSSPSKSLIFGPLNAASTSKSGPFEIGGPNRYDDGIARDRLAHRCKKIRRILKRVVSSFIKTSSPDISISQREAKRTRKSSKHRRPSMNHSSSDMPSNSTSPSTSSP